MRLLLPAACLAVTAIEGRASTRRSMQGEDQQSVPRGLHIKVEQGGVYFGPDQDTSLRRSAAGELTVDGVLLVGGMDVAALMQSVLTLQDEVATLRHLVFPKCADVDTTSASVNGGTYVGSTAVTGGDYLHDGDIEVECEDGYYFNDQLTWNCTETGGVATLSGRFCEPYVCASVSTADAETHGGSYTGATTDIKTGDTIAVSDISSVPCNSAYGWTDVLEWICPADGGVARPAERFCYSGNRCYSVDLSNVEVYDFTHEDNGPIAYTGYLPVHNGELLSRDDFTGLPVSTNDCLFRYDAEWICNVDGQAAGATVSVAGLCEESCFDVPSAIVAVGSVQSTTQMGNMNGPPVISADSNYVFAFDDTYGITTIDVSSKTSPTIVGSLPLLGARAGVLLPGGTHMAVTLFSQDKLCSVAVTDPTALTVVQTLSGDTDINDLFLGDWWQPGDGKTYLAFAQNSIKGVVILDATTPTALKKISSLQDTKLTSARDVLYGNGYLWVAAHGSDAVTGINVATPTAPVISGQYTSATFLDIPIEVDWLYNDPSTKKLVVAAYQVSRVTIVDVSTPATPTLFSSLQDNTNFAQIISAKPFGDFIFTCGQSVDTVAVVNAKDPANMFIEEKLTSTLLDGVRHVAIDGAYAYVISKVAATMTIVDVC